MHIANSQRLRVWAGVAVLFLILGLFVYGRSLSNGFVEWDDHMLIMQNPIVTQPGWAAVKAAFSSYDPELYVPLTYLTYQLNVLAGGLSPFGFHLVNFLLHVGASFLVALIVTLLLGRREAGIAGGLFFLVHPLNVEAVAWASARKDVLSAFFLFLAVLSYLLWRREKRQMWYALSLAAMLLACLSKVSAIVLPLLLLVIDLWQRRGWKTRIILEKTPFFALSLLFGAIALAGKVTGQALGSVKALLAAKATMFYLAKFIVPTNLSVMYPYTQEISPLTPDLLLSIIGVIGVTGIVIFLANRGYRAPLCGWAWYFIALLPTFNAAIRGRDELLDAYFASDRYAYVAIVGLLLPLLWLLLRIVEKSNKKAAAFVIAMVVSVFAMQSARQSLVWKNTEALFAHVVATYPNAHVAHTNLGVEYYRQDKIDEALAEFQAAIAIRPNAGAYYNIGQVMLSRGDEEGAIDAFRKAAASSAVDIDSHYYLISLLIQHGGYAEAQTALTHILEVAPEEPLLHAAQGYLYEKTGKTAEAIAAYGKALELDPTDEEIRVRMETLRRR